MYLALYVLAMTIMALYCTGFMLGPGLYNVEHIRKCKDNDEDYLFIFDVVQKKLNRTHDGFNPTFVFKTTFDHSYSVELEICKYVDGGCKLYLVLQDNDVTHFLDEYARKNVKRFMELAGVNPQKFPIPPGTLEAKNYIFNYEELPRRALYGFYEARLTVIDKGATVVGCIEVTVDFVRSDAKDMFDDV